MKHLQVSIVQLQKGGWRVVCDGKWFVAATAVDAQAQIHADLAVLADKGISSTAVITWTTISPIGTAIVKAITGTKSRIRKARGEV